jgi:hypothetical protein
MGIVLGGLSILFKGREYLTNWDFQMHVQIVHLSFVGLLKYGCCSYSCQTS